MERFGRASVPKSLAAAGLGAVLAILAWASGLTQRLDYLLYDSLHPLVQRAAPTDIVIVAVDDTSLNRLGRWPWSRGVHARLLDRLTEGGVAAVGFDILFAEPEASDPKADQAFARSIARNGRVVLAMAPDFSSEPNLPREILPIPYLAESARGLGHTDFELDQDGICRSQFLYAGAGSAHWRAFALALHQTAYGPLRPIPHAARDGTGWVREARMLIPFTGPPGRFQRLSYADVLAGTVPAERWRGRIVLVGSTAAGVGDLLAVPFSDAHARMPGVELNANVLAALNQGIEIRPLSQGVEIALIVALMLLPVLALQILPPAYAPLAFGATGILAVLGAALALSAALTWYSPAPVLLALIPAYVLWNWLHLRSFQDWIRELGSQIQHHVHHDPDTGLPTRDMLLAHMEGQIQARGASAPFALLVIHCDRLLGAHDRLGATVGRQLALSVSARLRSIAREQDFLGRLGQEEFALVISQLPDGRLSEALCARFVKAFDQPFDLVDQGQRVKLPATLGAALSPRDADGAAALLENAQTALERARHQSRGRFCLFSEDIRQERMSQARLEHDLDQALANGELVLHYQPQFNAAGKRILAFEALLRWESPGLGQIGPDEFIPAAERSGLIVPIGDRVLQLACAQAQAWVSDGVGNIRVAVNVSGLQLQHQGIVESVSRALRKSGLAPHRLELELTETILMRDIPATLEVMQALKRLGVKLAVDDFGTGYSSLGYLQRFPIDRVKIDRVFVADIGVRPETEDITRAIIDMAHRLKLKVVAEGVENAEQRDFLWTSGCDEIQGFLFGPPVDADTATAQLRSFEPHPLNPGLAGRGH